MIETTRRMLDEFRTKHRFTLKMIAKETGLGVPWLKSFSECKQDDYGVLRVEKLRNFLTNYKG